MCGAGRPGTAPAGVPASRELPCGAAMTTAPTMAAPIIASTMPCGAGTNATSSTITPVTTVAQ